VICSLIMQTTLLLKRAIMPRRGSSGRTQLPCTWTCTNLFQMLRRASLLVLKRDTRSYAASSSGPPNRDLPRPIFVCSFPWHYSPTTASTTPQFKSSLVSSCLLISPCWSIAVCHTWRRRVCITCKTCYGSPVSRFASCLRARTEMATCSPTPST
jgi:hypothetical protein